MSTIYNLFAGLDGTGNNSYNDTKLNDGSWTNIAKLHKLYEIEYGKNSLYEKGVGTVLLIDEQIKQVKDGLKEKKDFYKTDEKYLG